MANARHNEDEHEVYRSAVALPHPPVLIPLVDPDNLMGTRKKMEPVVLEGEDVVPYDASAKVQPLPPFYEPNTNLFFQSPFSPGEIMAKLEDLLRLFQTKPKVFFESRVNPLKKKWKIRARIFHTCNVFAVNFFLFWDTKNARYMLEVQCRGGPREIFCDVFYNDFVACVSEDILCSQRPDPPLRPLFALPPTMLNKTWTTVLMSILDSEHYDVHMQALESFVETTDMLTNQEMLSKPNFFDRIFNRMIELLHPLSPSTWLVLQFFRNMVHRPYPVSVMRAYFQDHSLPFPRLRSYENEIVHELCAGLQKDLKLLGEDC